jgi:UDP-N-acetyl-D-mannosaminuronic acid dehydrogenase
LPGNIVSELVENDRIIGGVTTNCAERAKEIYKIFVKADCMVTDCRVAELSKLVENSFRDVNIAFANELSLICDKLKVNVWELIKLANRHPRVDILQPGPGVGGHCIAVDPWFIVDSAPLESRLIRTARIVNDSKPEFVLNKVKQAIQILTKEPTELSIACLGLAFKPDIDDLRESPALDIAKKIGLMGFVKNYIVEPNIEALPNGFDALTNKLCDLDSALEGADIIVLLVDHISFKEIDIKILSDKKVIDTRGALNGK